MTKYKLTNSGSIIEFSSQVAADAWKAANNSAAEVTTFDETIPTDTVAVFRVILTKAIQGANNLMESFAAENMAMGITQAGKTKLIADTLEKAFYYAKTGSLYQLKAELLTVVPTAEMSPFITADRLTVMSAKVDNVLANL